MTDTDDQISNTVWALLQLPSLADVISSSGKFKAEESLVITVNLVTFNVVTFGHCPNHYSINGSSVPDATFLPSPLDAVLTLGRDFNQVTSLLMIRIDLPSNFALALTRAGCRD